MKKPKGSKPAKGAKQPKGAPAHHHHHAAHLTPQQQRQANRARIRSLQRALHNARHPGPQKKSAPAKKPRKPRGLALGEAVPCCAAEALAASARLAGWPVGDADVLALHEAAGGSEDQAVSILAVLEAASVFGLAGVRLRDFHSCAREITALVPDDGFARETGSVAAALTVEAPALPPVLLEPVLHRAMRQAYDTDVVGHGLILGLELPGAHAVTLAPDGSWLSWGGTCDPAGWPHAVIEETWVVRWP